ncbi:hypothetical protein evm_011377 [Chilo suppressalis]|nr:hypothetical protein evm_011377 [Chilo suppressalis]
MLEIIKLSLAPLPPLTQFKPRGALKPHVSLYLSFQAPPTFDWSHSIQAVILSSFFWGYVVLQIPAGTLARRFGGKILITISLTVNSLTSFFLPVAAKYGGWQLVCACRILQGLTQAFVYPCMHHLISQWIPLEEKGLLSTIIYAGGQLGIAIQLLVGGMIASAWGWPAIFYTNGSLGVIWVVAYLVFGSATPEQSKIISEQELGYIQRSLGRFGEQKHYPVPWKKIMTCLPFWAVIVAHCGQNWGFFTLMTEMPSYMSKVLGFELKRNGILSSLPYLAMYLLSFPMGSMTDRILKKDWLSVTNTRKLFNSIAHSSQPTNIIIPSCLRASYTTFTESRSPLKNFPAPTSISSAANVTSPLPLQFANSVGYVGVFGSLSDYNISDAVLQGYSEHSPYHSSLSDFKLVDSSSRDCPRLSAPINVPTAGAQAFPMDGIGRLGHDPPLGPSADWWALTTANAAGTNGLTCLPKHGGARDSKFLVTHPMTDHCESCLTSTIAAERASHLRHRVLT